MTPSPFISQYTDERQTTLKYLLCCLPIIVLLLKCLVACTCDNVELLLLSKVDELNSIT